MDTLQKPVFAARRRLIVQSLLDWTSRIGLIAFCVAAVAIVVAKFVWMPIPFQTWTMWWLSGAAIAVCILAPTLAIWFREPFNSVATLVDQRLKLRERISSASQMSEAERATPMGAALWNDAVNRAQSLDVRDAFPVRVNTHVLRVAVPLAVVGVSFLLPDPQLDTQKVVQSLTIEQVKNSLTPILQQVRKHRIEAEEKNLEEAELLKELENKLQDLQKKPPKDPSKLMADLKKMQDQIEDKRRQMGTGESLKKQLASVKKIEDGPAEQLADAMKDGDMEAASEQVQSLMDKLDKEQLSKEEQQQLAKQLEQFEKALQESIDKHNEEKKELEEQIKQAQAAGDKQKAEELSEKLDELKQKDADMQAASDLKSAMSQASECLKSGDCKSASQKLSKMKGQLSKMAADAKNAESLKELNRSMNDSKRSSSCSKCNGQGCSQCMGKGSQSSSWQKGKGGGKNGKGIGNSRSTSNEGDHQDDTKSYETQVRGNVGEGELAMGGQIGGENKKTPSNNEFKETVLSTEVEEADPIEQARLPKRERDISKEYMDSVRNGN